MNYEPGRRCSSCGARLARDHADTTCSPCRRGMIENAAQREAGVARDSSQIKAVFDSSGLYGVADLLDSTPAEAVDVLIRSRLIPYLSERRREILRQLVTLGGSSHVAVAKQLNISRWTVAAYRQQLGIDRSPEPARRERVRPAA